MMTVDASQWDETICNMIACQHPPCWEALRRIEKGVPRILFKISGRDSPESGDELPTLKIVDLPFNYSQKDHLGCSESSTSISKAISSIRNARGFHSNSTLNEVLFPSVPVVRTPSSSEKNLSPGLNSRVESHTPYCTPIGFNFWRPSVQVSDLGVLVDPSQEQQTHQPAVVVRWVPGLRHKLLQPENSTTRIETSLQRMRVKELALESILSLTEKPEFLLRQSLFKLLPHRVVVKTQEKRKKSSKVPTGGQPYLLHLKNQKALNGKSSHPTGKGRNQNVSPGRKRQYLPNHGLLQSDSALDLEKRKGRLTEGKEKLVLPIIVKKAPSLNKCDYKIAMTEKGLRKRPGQTSKQEAASKGSAPLTCSVPNAAQQMEDTAVPPQQFRRAFSEKGLQLDVSPCLAASRVKTSVKFVEYKSNKTDLTMEGLAPLLPPTDGLQFPAGRALISKSSPCLSPPLKPMEGRQFTTGRVHASRSAPGYDSSVAKMSKSKSYYNVLCKISSKQKEAALAPDSREQWPKGAAQKEEESFLPPDPPPPPPSPLLSEISENCFPDLT